VPVNLWANRIVRHEDTVDPSTLTLHPENPKIHPREDTDPLAAVLGGDIGWISSVTVNTETGHVLNGHRRVKQAGYIIDRPAVVDADPFPAHRAPCRYLPRCARLHLLLQDDCMDCTLAQLGGAAVAA
jgi:hypothetical protein